MAEKQEALKERTLQETSTWSVAVVCVVLLAISIFIEHVIHLLGKWLKNRRKPALFEALEVVKNELMLLGFISLLLTVFQEHIAGICISEKIASTWLPCSNEEMSKIYPKGRRLLDFSAGTISRRSLATKGYDKCTKEEGKVAFVTAYGIHQLHIFIFVLAIFHVLYGITTLALGTFKMRKWKVWENETKTTEYQFYNDPERFRFARDTSFGRRHLSFWSRSPISLWIVCFFRQFLASVTKVDYMVLRHGFIMAHLAPENAPRFDFQNYISRSLEEDFKVVVGISPTIWFTAVLSLLSNTHGWYSYLWLPFISLIIILMVGTKLQVIITKMGLRIQERGDVVKGTPLVQPGDELFWFGRPRFILFLIHFVLFQNAFQLAFFAWSTWQFKVQNCFHYKPEEIIIRIAMGVIIQILCSYVTLPLYALVTQMGSTMKPTIFHDRVATALRHWHHGARRHVKHSQHSNNPTPSGTAPATPEHGSSPIHLLHHYQQRSLDSLPTSPRKSDDENEQWAVVGLQSPQNQGIDSRHLDTTGQEGSTQQPNSTSNQHEIDITLSDFSFQKHS